ncbi:MAG: energy-coupling factor transporter transmembrane component T family protein [Candidatus Limnocylindria bacterium]
MRASFHYIGRGSWLARRDPRTMLLAALLFVIGAIQLRDARHLALALGFGLAYYATARIPWRRVRAQWIYLATIIIFIAGINTIITGGRAGGFAADEVHVLFRIPLLGAPITAEAISLSVSQILRFLGFVAVSIPIAYTVAPGDFGVAFRRLGLPDRLAFALDLTIRFIPSLGAEFAETIAAQRVRGYDPARGSRNPIRRIRQFAPVLVPVTVGAIANAEDTIDAMDLRAFGTGRRSWYRELRYDRADWLVILAFACFAALTTALNLGGLSDHYLLPFLV